VPRLGYRRWKRTALDLTERQEEVLRLIERGLTNGEIAESLGITLDGAKFHVSEILSKLGVSKREDAVTAWRAHRREKTGVPALALLKWGLAAAGAVGVVAAVLLVWAAAREDEGDIRVVPGPSPAAVVAVTSVPPIACPPPRTPTPTGRTPIPVPPMDGPGSVHFKGRSYTYALGVTPPGARPLDRALVGEKFGEACFDVSTTWPLDPSDDGRRDGDAFHVRPGTEFFTVVGYKPSFRLTAPANGEYYIFQSMPGEGDLASDFLDIEGKVRTVLLYRDDGRGQYSEVGSTTDTAVIDELVAALLLGRAERRPTDRSMDAYILVRLILADGTEVNFGFHPDAGFLDFYRVPNAFGEQVDRLIAAGARP